MSDIGIYDEFNFEAHDDCWIAFPDQYHVWGHIRSFECEKWIIDDGALGWKVESFWFYNMYPDDHTEKHRFAFETDYYDSLEDAIRGIFDGGFSGVLTGDSTLEPLDRQRLAKRNILCDVRYWTRVSRADEESREDEE